MHTHTQKAYLIYPLSGVGPAYATHVSKVFHHNGADLIRICEDDVLSVVETNHSPGHKPPD